MTAANQLSSNRKHGLDVTEYGNRQQQNFSHNHPKSPLWILAKKSCRRLAEEGCNRTIDAEGEIATDKKWTMNEMPQSAASPPRSKCHRETTSDLAAARLDQR